MYFSPSLPPSPLHSKTTLSHGKPAMAVPVTLNRTYVSHIGEGLQSATEVPELHNNSSSITSLNLHSNRITRIDPCVSRLVNLTALNLSSNSIRAIACLSGLLHLTSLNLASNSLCELHGLAGLTALQQLNASYNAITCIAGISELHGSSGSLQQLNLQHNKLSSLQALAPLAGCLQLQQLKVGGNPCTISRAAYVALRQVLPHVRQLDESEAASLAASWQMAQAQLQAFDHSAQQQQHPRQPSSVRLDQDSRSSKAAKKQHARDAHAAVRSLPQPRARPVAHPADMAGSPQHVRNSQSSSDGDNGSSDSPNSHMSDSKDWPDAGAGQAAGTGRHRAQQQLPLQPHHQQHEQQVQEDQRRQAATAQRQHKARNKSSNEQHAAGRAVAKAEAVAQTDEYTPPMVGQLQAEAQVLREQLSKLAGRCCKQVGRQSPCLNNSATSSGCAVLLNYLCAGAVTQHQRSFSSSNCVQLAVSVAVLVVGVVWCQQHQRVCHIPLLTSVTCDILLLLCR